MNGNEHAASGQGSRAGWIAAIAFVALAGLALGAWTISLLTDDDEEAAPAPGQAEVIGGNAAGSVNDDQPADGEPSDPDPTEDSPASDSTSTGSSSVPPEPFLQSGNWATTVGSPPNAADIPLALTLDGDTVDVVYLDGMGETSGISVDADAGTVVGNWNEAASLTPSAPLCDNQVNSSSRWGEFEWAFSDDGQSFTGWSNFCGDTSRQLTWTGQLQ